MVEVPVALSTVITPSVHCSIYDVLSAIVVVMITSTAQVLQCISRLELAQLVGTGVKTKYITHGGQQVKGPTQKRVNNVHQQPQRQNSFTIDTVLSGTGEWLLVINALWGEPEQAFSITEIKHAVKSLIPTCWVRNSLN